MSDVLLKDARGALIGRLSTDRNGIQTIKDHRGQRKGTYDPKTNRTKDARGAAVGMGNLLSSLL